MFCFSKTLTDDFRRNYIEMWMAILKGNVDQIKSCAMTMGIKDDTKAGLLACMISSKPWSAIERGLENVPDEATRKKEVSLSFLLLFFLLLVYNIVFSHSKESFEKMPLDI